MLALSYWLSRRKPEENELEKDDSSSLTEINNDSAVANPLPKTTAPKKKKHNCGCGSKKTEINRPIENVKILFGTLTGKSKVCC